MIPEITITQALLIVFIIICILPKKRRDNVVKNIKSLLEVLLVSKLMEEYISYKKDIKKIEKLKDNPYDFK